MNTVKTAVPTAALVLGACLTLVGCTSDDSQPEAPDSTATATATQAAPASTFLPPEPSDTAIAGVSFSADLISYERGIALEGEDYYFRVWCPDGGGFTAEVHDENGRIMAHGVPCDPEQPFMSTALTGEGQEIWITLTDEGELPTEGFLEITPMPATQGSGA